MASLPSRYPALAVYLSDLAHTPLLSSDSSSETQSHALAALNTASLTAYASISRLELGLPQRVMIETSNGGPIVIHSFLNPQSSLSQQANIDRNTAPGTLELTARDGHVLTTTDSPEDDQGTEASSEQDVVEQRLMANGTGNENEHENVSEMEHKMEETDTIQAPLLIATVVAPRYEAVGQARHAIANLEIVGAEVQRGWVRARMEEAEHGLEREAIDS